jgi:hypothetical protein
MTGAGSRQRAGIGSRHGETLPAARSKLVMTAGLFTEIKTQTHPGARTPVTIATLKQTHWGRRMGYLRRPFLRQATACLLRGTPDMPYERTDFRF